MRKKDNSNQLKMNKKYHIKPVSIKKPIREKLVEYEEEPLFERATKSYYQILPEIDISSLTPMDKKKLLIYLRREMKEQARDLNFELAAEIRDKIREIDIN